MKNINNNIFYGVNIMDNELKNFGVSFALSRLVDGLSLTKYELPTLDKSCFHLTSENKDIDYIIDLNDENREVKSLDVLANVINYINAKTGKNKPLEFVNYADADNHIVKCFSDIREEAKRWNDGDFQNLMDSHFAQDDYFGAINDRINQFFDDLCDGYHSKKYISKEDEALEMALASFEAIYGEWNVDVNTISEDFTLGALIDTESQVDTYLEELENISEDDSDDFEME